MRTPDFYKCSKCEKHGVKLWRVGASSHVELFCIDCAFERESEWIIAMAKIDFLGHVRSGLPGDQIGGGLVPAIPDFEGDDDWWGYFSVPEDLRKWWHSLEPKMKLGEV